MPTLTLSAPSLRVCAVLTRMQPVLASKNGLCRGRPRFIFRMLILASEDVGLADPNAVVVINACVEAFDRVGMPEGRYHLAQATLYLTTHPSRTVSWAFRCFGCC